MVTYCPREACNPTGRARVLQRNRGRVGPLWYHTAWGGGGEVKTESAHSSVVLIASKQEWISRALETILAPRGYCVRTAFTRSDTLAQLQREPPDAVILDELREITAQEFCRELREHRLIPPTTPTLLTLSSPATRRDRLAAWRAGAWACLGDPLDAEELLAILDAFVPAKLAADQSRTDSLIDEVTGVYNVRGVTRRARELAAQASRQNGALGCVLLAPDLSDPSNDAKEEEQLLQSIADSLKASARTSDAIGRLGSTAFIIIAVNTDAAQAHGLGQRLADAVLATPHPNGKRMPQQLKLFGGCHGVSDFRTAAIDESELMLRATAALDLARSEPTGSWLRDYEEDT